jgi:hypothetical protein
MSNFFVYICFNHFDNYFSSQLYVHLLFGDLNVLKWLLYCSQLHPTSLQKVVFGRLNSLPEHIHCYLTLGFKKNCQSQSDCISK